MVGRSDNLFVRIPQRPSQTKIIATVGPASRSAEMIERLVNAGVDVFRINTAHGDRSQREEVLGTIRAVSQRLGRPVGVLVDLAGPKLRLGKLLNGKVECRAGETLRFVRADAATRPDELTSTYERLIDELEPGHTIMLADGMVHLVVEEKQSDQVICRVVQPGIVRSGQGINLPDVPLTVPALGPEDKENAIWAAENGVDFIGLSFVRFAEEVRQLKQLIQRANSSAQVVAKIEKREALQNLEQIVEESDAVMIARGDLGVETDIAQVAVVQKQIISLCHRKRRPVIVATQMLDSMHHSRIPTRAEVADVSNAILDGADACMLSGETAIGEYPCEAVEMMHRIALAAESLCRKRERHLNGEYSDGLNPITEATVFAAVVLAEKLDAKLLAVATASGRTALSVSKLRTFVPTLGMSHNAEVLRRMCLYWGIVPLECPAHASADQMLKIAIEWGTEHGLLKQGDRLVLIAGTGLKTTAHNMVLVHQLD